MKTPNAHPTVPETIQQQARKLRLSGLLASLPLRLAEAQTHPFDAARFLESVLQDELNVRHQRELARRQSAANFRESRALESFDFGFNASINRQQVYELASCQVMEEKRDVIPIGPLRGPPLGSFETEFCIDFPPKTDSSARFCLCFRDRLHPEVPSR